MSNTMPAINGKSVMPNRSVASSTAAASNFSTNTAVAPCNTRQSRCETNTGVWVSGLRQAPTPAAPSPRAVAQAKVDHSRLACVTITPLGAPVVPEV